MDKNVIIKNFIELPAPDRYDLRFATAEESIRHDGFRDAYEKFFIYKYNKKMKEDWNREKNKETWDNDWKKMGEDSKSAKDEFEKKADEYDIMKDPDGHSDLRKEIYKALWGKEAKYSDAMTSVQGLLKDALKKIIDKKIIDKNKKNYDESVYMVEKEKYIVRKDVKKNYQDILDTILMFYDKFPNQKDNGYWTVILNAVITAKLGKKFYRFIDHYYPNMREFMNRCFAIGNYCPVSKGFNNARSTYDYWDLTLMKIREWYMTGDDAELSELLKKRSSDSDIDNCKKWLNLIAGEKKGENAWICFVDKLYMQDYVEDAISGNYKVKPFWTGHDWENPGTESLKTIKEMNDALIEISARIAARSVRILNALREKIEEK